MESLQTMITIEFVIVNLYMYVRVILLLRARSSKNTRHVIHVCVTFITVCYVIQKYAFNSNPNNPVVILHSRWSLHPAIVPIEGAVLFEVV